MKGRPQDWALGEEDEAGEPEAYLSTLRIRTPKSDKAQGPRLAASTKREWGAGSRSGHERDGAPGGRREAFKRGADALARKLPVEASPDAPQARRPSRLASRRA